MGQKELPDHTRMMDLSTLPLTVQNKNEYADFVKKAG